MPAHCQSDMAEVPESVNMSTKTASEGILKRLKPPSIRRRSRSSRDSSSIFSTTLTRQGSGSGLLMKSSPHGSPLGAAEKIKTTKGRPVVRYGAVSDCPKSVSDYGNRDKPPCEKMGRRDGVIPSEPCPPPPPSSSCAASPSTTTRGPAGGWCCATPTSPSGGASSRS